MAERRNLNTNEIALEETKLLYKMRIKHQILAKVWQEWSMMLTLKINVYKSWIKRFKVFRPGGSSNLKKIGNITNHVLLIPNCTRQRMITYTNISKTKEDIKKVLIFLSCNSSSTIKSYCHIFL